MSKITLTKFLAMRMVDDAYKTAPGFDEWYDGMTTQERSDFEHQLHLSAREVLKDYTAVALCPMVELQVEEP